MNNRSSDSLATVHHRQWSVLLCRLSWEDVWHFISFHCHFISLFRSKMPSQTCAWTWTQTCTSMHCMHGMFATGAVWVGLVAMLPGTTADKTPSDSYHYELWSICLVRQPISIVHILCKYKYSFTLFEFDTVSVSSMYVWWCRLKISFFSSKDQQPLLI